MVCCSMIMVIVVVMIIFILIAILMLIFVMLACRRHVIATVDLNTKGLLNMLVTAGVLIT